MSTPRLGIGTPVKVLSMVYRGEPGYGVIMRDFFPIGLTTYAIRFVNDERLEVDEAHIEEISKEELAVAEVMWS